MATAASHDSQFRQTDFVGRYREMAELRAGIERVLSGDAQLFLLTGEPGIGKTRIATEIAREGGLRGMRVAWGSGSEATGAPAYWPLIQIARSLVGSMAPSGSRVAISALPPEIAGLLDLRRSLSRIESVPDPERARFQLFDAFAQLLRERAQAQPLMLALDDLQDADQTSCLMLRFIAREVREVPLMIVAAYRDSDARHHFPGTGQVLSDLLRVGRQIALAGLSSDEVRQVIESSAGRAANRRFIAALHRATGGNPFFVTEVVRTLAASGALADPRWRWEEGISIPLSVRASIRARISAMPAPLADVLSAAAALGYQFELGPLQKVCAKPMREVVRALGPAEDAGIVHRADGSAMRYRFSHALIREVLHDDLDPERRVELHRQIVAVLEDIYRAEPERHLDELAYHSVAAAEAGDAAARAIDYASRAAESAYRAFAYEQAAQHWHAALTLAEQQGCEPERLAQLLERLGDAWSITEFDQPKGIESLERAAGIYESIGKPLEGAQVRARLAVMLSAREPALNIPRALDQYRKAEQVLRSGPDSESQVWLYSGLAQAAYQRQHTEEGLAASRRAMEIAGRLGNEGLWVRAAAYHSDHLFSAGRLAEAESVAEDAWQKADRLNDLRGAFECAWSGGYHPLALWDPRGAQRWLLRELPRPRLAQAAYQRQILLQQMAFSHVFTGNLAEARSLLAQAPRGVIEGFLLMCEGEWDRADEVLDAAREKMRQVGSRDGETVHAYFQARVCHAAGELARAQSLLETVVEAGQAGPVLPFELHARTELAIIAAGGGRIEDAADHLRRCREILAAGEDYRGVVGRVAAAEATLAAASRDNDSLARHFSAALEIFRRYDLVWEQAQAHRLWGRALLAAGDRRGAMTQFDAAIDLYRRHGGGARWIDGVDADRRQCEGSGAKPSGTRAGGAEQIAHGIFRDEGDYWTVALNSSLVRMRTSKGLRYIAYLLARPGEKTPPLQLTRMGNGAAHRKSERGRSERSSDERAAERSRVMVTKSIKAAVSRIRASNAALGRHLAVSIRTGNICVYEPDPEHPISWRLRE
jgi:tetratricopeptide (TPR) repeat protein